MIAYYFDDRDGLPAALLERALGDVRSGLAAFPHLARPLLEPLFGLL